MKTIIKNKLVDYLYIILGVCIIIFNLTRVNKNIYYTEDIIYLLILSVSFIIINKLYININESKIILSDFLIIIIYFRFGILTTILFIFYGYLFTYFIEIIFEKWSNIDIGLFNMSMLIISTFTSYLILNFINSLIDLSSTQLILVIIFSINFLIVNLFLFDLYYSITYKKLFILTMENGLYYILISFIISTSIATLSISLSSIYNYTPTIVIVVLLIFSSFSINTFVKLKKQNSNLKYISNCTNMIISKGDLKSKYYEILTTLEKIIPFSYCGLYLSRDNYNSIYPICYKSNYIIDIDKTKLNYSKKSISYSNLQTTKILYISKKSLINNILPLSIDNVNIESLINIPIISSDVLIGFILIGLPSNKGIGDESQFFNILSNQVALVNENISSILSNNSFRINTYYDLTSHIDFNIANRIFFNLSIIELINYREIIEHYNEDFYLNLKAHMVEYIKTFLSHKDRIISTEKNTIYVVFDLLDTANSIQKLRNICQHLKVYNYNNIDILIDTIFSTAEFPSECLTKEELFNLSFSNLYKKRNA